MNSLRGRPEITETDHPRTVYSALLSSIAFYNRTMPESVATNWVHTAQDGYEAVQDGFGIVDAANEPLRPKGKANLYLTLGQLELALVNFGCEMLDDPEQEDAMMEVANIDELLVSIDTLRIGEHS